MKEVLNLSLLLAIFFAGCSAQSCTEGDVRLVGGRHSLEGRLEVCALDMISDLVGWGTVCNDGWDRLDAQVVCRQLGLQQEQFENIFPSVFFEISESNATFVLSDVECVGNETSIVNCTSNDVPICAEPEAVGLICRAQDPPECEEYQVRLLNATGGNAAAGLVEVCIGGGWGTVCDTAWDNDDAKVVCEQVGEETAYARTINRFSSPPEAGSRPIVLDYVRCTGMEDQLTECPRGIYVEGCFHGMDVGVNCTKPDTPPGNGGTVLKMSVKVLIMMVLAIVLALNV